MTLDQIQAIAEDALVAHQDRLFPDMDPARFTAPYYAFLRLLAAHIEPQGWLVDLGTREGYSAYAMAAGAEPGRAVLSIDDRPDTVQQEVRHPGVRYHVGDSRIIPEGVHSVALLFLDTTHDGDTAYHELLAWRPLLVQGAVVVLDDVAHTEAMHMLWKSMDPPKVRLDALHGSGFGVLLR